MPDWTPVVPPVDSQSQTAIRRKIVMEAINRTYVASDWLIHRLNMTGIFKFIRFADANSTVVRTDIFHYRKLYENMCD